MLKCFFLLTLMFLNLGPSQIPDQNKKEEVPIRISAPIFYKDLMLILASKEGVVAIIFTKEIHHGVHYQYRFLEKASKKEIFGQGIFCEKKRFLPADKPNAFWVIDEGSQLFFKIGSSMELEWSYSMPGRGWIYYLPERLRVQIAHQEYFKTIDLHRFQIK